MASFAGFFWRDFDPRRLLGGVLLFPVQRQGLATTMAGVLAVLAPTVGPIVGGWITQTYSWHWLFLINVAPGIISAVLAGLLLPRTPTRFSEMRTLDIPSLSLL